MAASSDLPGCCYPAKLTNPQRHVEDHTRWRCRVHDRLDVTSLSQSRPRVTCQLARPRLWWLLVTLQVSESEDRHQGQLIVDVLDQYEVSRTVDEAVERDILAV